MGEERTFLNEAQKRIWSSAGLGPVVFVEREESKQCDSCNFKCEILEYPDGTVSIGAFVRDGVVRDDMCQKYKKKPRGVIENKTKCRYYEPISE